MSYSLDANILLYASNTACPEHKAAVEFLRGRSTDPDLMCLTWPALMAYQRIATHPSIFANPLSPAAAWKNIEALLKMPRARVLSEEADFSLRYKEVTGELHVAGNLVPDAHIATLLLQHGVGRIYTADSDFRKFDFLKVVNPFKKRAP